MAASDDYYCCQISDELARMIFYHGTPAQETLLGATIFAPLCNGFCFSDYNKRRYEEEVVAVESGV